jgi:hypothetical protein
MQLNYLEPYLEQYQNVLYYSISHQLFDTQDLAQHLNLLYTLV